MDGIREGEVRKWKVGKVVGGRKREGRSDLVLTRKSSASEADSTISFYRGLGCERNRILSTREFTWKRTPQVEVRLSRREVDRSREMRKGEQSSRGLLRCRFIEMLDLVYCRCR